MLPLTFNNKEDYDLVKPDDKVPIVGPCRKKLISWLPASTRTL